jgi:fucose 4-O-acetylase-like acetyltransferase
MLNSINRGGQTRIKYLDAAKGLLMLCLIEGHMIIFARELGLENQLTPYIQNSVPFYRCFFMQTFFLITGFCTNWEINFREFISKNFKTLIFPALVVLPLFIFNRTLIINGVSESLGAYVFRYFIDGMPWFLSALFLAKLFYYIINRKAQTSVAKLSLAFVAFIIGLVICESESSSFQIRNIWNFKQALIMLPFLAIGRELKFLNSQDVKFLGKGLLSYRNLALFSLPYFGIILLWQLLGLRLGFPAVDYFVEIHYRTAPFHIIFALSGSALILLISHMLENSKFLNLFGRQSLFVYITHITVVMIVMKITEFIIGNVFDSYLFYIIVFIVSIALLSIGCKLIQNKYLSWLVGKF